MIKILTDDGFLLDLEDSKLFITFKILDMFLDIIEFKECSEIHDPCFWGEYFLTKDVKFYSDWINQIAEATLIR